MATSCLLPLPLPCRMAYHGSEHPEGQLLGPAQCLAWLKPGLKRHHTMLWMPGGQGAPPAPPAGIAMIKFSAWEAPFTTAVMGARDQEAKILRLNACWLVSMRAATCAVHATHMCAGA